MMQERLAFTANFWGDAAVVCRAIEDHPGPVADLQFGQFETWTQAQVFAARLNEGLELDPAEARQIVTSSMLCTSELLRDLESPEIARTRLPAFFSGKPHHVQFVLAELNLAINFCRMAHSKPAALAERMHRNIRNALFSAMHYVCHPELTAREVERIREAMQGLQAVIQEPFSQQKGLVVAAGESPAGSSENNNAPDSEERAPNKIRIEVASKSMPCLKKWWTYPFTEISQPGPRADESFAADDSDGIGAPVADTLRSFTSRLDNSTVGVAFYDERLLCRAVNAAFYTMHNMTTSALVGKTVRQIFGDEAPELEPIFHRVWETGNRFSNFRLTTQPLAAPEKARWLVNLYPIKDESGQVRLVAITFSEVTKRNNVESHLSRLTNKFQPDSPGKSNVFGEEFTQRSARTLDLVRRSVELLRFSMSLRCHVSESRIENGLLRQALFLGGTRARKLVLRPALPRRRSEAAQPLPPETPNRREPPADCPSPRERQVLFYLADGKSNKEIGTALEISTRTVEFYRARIMLKLDLHSTAALVRYAIRNNIVEA